MRTGIWFCSFLFSILTAFHAAAQPLDTVKIEKIIGLKGTLNTNENVFKITVPRDDVRVTVDGWTMSPFMGLASWAAFTPVMDQTMMMGDTALFEDEVNPVMSVALDNGLAVTALHNHFFFDDPKIYFMHISGEGDVEKLASAVKKVWDKVKDIRNGNPVPGTTFAGVMIPPKNSITPKPIEKIFGVKGQTNNGMFKIVIAGHAKMSGMNIGKDMGVNTWAAFAGNDDLAVVDGDFVVPEDKLQVVLKTLRDGDINIVAIHQHMIGETPRMMFLHYWGKASTKNLAKTLKAALDAETKPDSKD